MSDLKTSVIEYAISNEKNLEIAYVTKEAFSNTTGDWVFPEINKDELTFLITNKNWTSDIKFGLKEFPDIDRACFAVDANPNIKQNIYNYVREKVSGSKCNEHWWWLRFNQPYNRWRESFDGIKSLYNRDKFLEYAVLQIIELSNYIESYLESKDSDIK